MPSSDIENDDQASGPSKLLSCNSLTPTPYPQKVSGAGLANRRAFEGRRRASADSHCNSRLGDGVAASWPKTSRTEQHNNDLK